MLSIPARLCLLGVLAANLYYWLTVLAAWRFRLGRGTTAQGSGSPATVIIPLKGVDAALERNLRRFCRLQYPVYQLIFALESAEDPALEAVAGLVRDFPELDIETAVTRHPIGANPKENNHAAALARAKYDLIVLADGDVAARPDHLTRVLAPLSDPKVGLVTCPYRFTGGDGSLWGALKSLNIEASFIPSVMVAWLLAPVRFGIGATLAFKRRALERAGGLAAVADYIASDYRLARNIARAGFEVRLIPYQLDIELEALDFAGYLDYELRWVRTMRFTAPWGYAGTLVTHGLPWSLGLWCLGGGGMPLALTLCSRWLTCALSGVRAASLPLVPLHDLAASGFWLAGWLGNRVKWAGRAYELSAGTLIAARTR